MTRRKLLIGGAASMAAAVAYPFGVEPSWLELTTTRVKLGGAARGSLRILQLTDIHSSFEVPFWLINNAIEMGLAAKPDIVCLTGDFVTRGSEYDEATYGKVLGRLAAAKPTFAVLGNHDGGAWAESLGGPSSHHRISRMLEESGIEQLHNRSRSIEVRGSEFNLAGVGDLWSGDVRPEAALQPEKGDLPMILLAHNPDSKELVQRYAWDLMVCGHTHGGQIVIPFEGPRWAPVRDKRFVAGLKPWDGRQIYVSRGVGSLSHVRFRCRPEVTILDVVTGDQAAPLPDDHGAETD